MGLEQALQCFTAIFEAAFDPSTKDALKKTQNKVKSNEKKLGKLAMR